MKKTVYFIEGDGVGKEIWQTTRPVLDAAVAKSGNGKLCWRELLAGKKAWAECGEYLPQATLDALSKAELAMKGPLETPVGGGIRSLNVALRQTLDLYACIRPIRYFDGIASPLKRPQDVNMVVFRENTEDVYAGIEWAAKTPEAKRLAEFLRDQLGAPLGSDCAIGIKPVSEKGCKRLVRKALQYCVEQKRPSLTLVHKGNIMKFTEGAFRAWGYEVAAQEFADTTRAEQDNKPNSIVVKDRIADAMFQEALLHPRDYSVLATTNLNGDYLSDALAAQVGGLGMAPGLNMNDNLAFFEATHGTAPAITGKDIVNPCSLILSGALLLRHIGWHEAAQRVEQAIEETIRRKTVTRDLANQMENATAVGCQEFGEQLARIILDF